MEKKVEQGVEQEMDGGIIEELERAVDGGTTDEVGNETVEEIEWKKVDIGATKEVELKEVCHWAEEEVEQQVDYRSMVVMKEVEIRTAEERKHIDNQTVEEVEQERKEVDFGTVEVVEQLKGVDSQTIEEVETEVEKCMDRGYVELMKEMDVRAVEEVKQRMEHGGVEKVMEEVRNGSLEQVEQEVNYVNPKEVMTEVENKGEMVQEVDRGAVEEVVRLELNEVDDVGHACLDVVDQTPMQVDHRAKEVAAVERILISQAPSEDGCRAEHLSTADKNVFPGPVTTDSETAESRQGTVAPCKQLDVVHRQQQGLGKNVDVWTVKREGAAGQGIANVEVHGGRCWYVCAEVDCGTRFRRSGDAQLHEQVHRLCAPVCSVDVWDMFDTGVCRRHGGGKGEMFQPCCASPKKSHGETIAAQEPKVGREGDQLKFVCDVSGCNRSYIWLSSLKRHVSFSHGACDEAVTEERDLVKPAEGGNAVDEAETVVPRQSSSEVQTPKQKVESVRADCTHNKRAKWPAIYKNDKYICCKCYKTFDNPQQLGGHLSARKNCIPSPLWMSDGGEQKQSMSVFDGSVDKLMEVGGDAPCELGLSSVVSDKDATSEDVTRSKKDCLAQKLSAPELDMLGNETQMRVQQWPHVTDKACRSGCVSPSNKGCTLKPCGEGTQMEQQETTSNLVVERQGSPPSLSSADSEVCDGTISITNVCSLSRSAEAEHIQSEGSCPSTSSNTPRDFWKTYESDPRMAREQALVARGETSVSAPTAFICPPPNLLSISQGPAEHNKTAFMDPQFTTKAIRMVMGHHSILDEDDVDPGVSDSVEVNASPKQVDAMRSMGFPARVTGKRIPCCVASCQYRAATRHTLLGHYINCHGYSREESYRLAENQSMPQPVKSFTTNTPVESHRQTNKPHVGGLCGRPPSDVAASGDDFGGNEGASSKNWLDQVAVQGHCEQGPVSSGGESSHTLISQQIAQARHRWPRKAHTEMLLKQPYDLACAWEDGKAALAGMRKKVPKKLMCGINGCTRVYTCPGSLKQHVAVSHKEYKRVASPQQYMLPESLVIEHNKAGADTLLTLQREKQETWSPWLAQEHDRLLSGCSHNRYAKWPAIYKNGKYVCSRCYRAFDSPKSLGGHLAHKTNCVPPFTSPFSERGHPPCQMRPVTAEAVSYVVNNSAASEFCIVAVEGGASFGVDLGATDGSQVGRGEIMNSQLTADSGLHSQVISNSECIDNSDFTITNVCSLSTNADPIFYRSKDPLTEGSSNPAGVFPGAAGRHIIPSLNPQHMPLTGRRVHTQPRPGLQGERYSEHTDVRTARRFNNGSGEPDGMPPARETNSESHVCRVPHCKFEDLSRTALLAHYAEGHAGEERVAEPPTVPFGCLFKDCDAKFPGHRGLRLHYKSRHKVNDQQLEKLCVETADVRAASPGFSPVECSVVEMAVPVAAAEEEEEEGDRAAGPALQASGLPRPADEAAVTSPLLLIVMVEADEGRWPGEAAPARGPAGKSGRLPRVGEGAPSIADAGPKWADRRPRDAL
uniref:Uncharacterized protein LOC116955484 n=1 Tax=Petromyzon marinus TaxID=7757 RepID=A0AAJ7UC25_PETMA|nr:uncharacterized protein LOC116955484 [Petromyzon marinus]XP_032832486.1 uncharacterized protein LOC116955484 [Petromyzon marinus]XP_032832487.1 uncharacterized protein LOC116955484 [Petromyzon marinus]